jgi:hypothetical protein
MTRQPYPAALRRTTAPGAMAALGLLLAWPAAAEEALAATASARPRPIRRRAPSPPSAAAIRRPSPDLRADAPRGGDAAP